MSFCEVKEVIKTHETHESILDEIVEPANEATLMRISLKSETVFEKYSSET